MNYEARKQAKVDAQNLVNKRIMELFPLLVAWLTPFIGEKILKADGCTLLKKVKDAEPVFVKDGFRWFGRVSPYSIFIEADQMLSADENSCVYQKQSLYFAQISDGILQSIMEVPPQFRTDLTKEEIDRILEEIKQKKDEIYKLQIHIAPFGEGLFAH